MLAVTRADVAAPIVIVATAATTTSTLDVNHAAHASHLDAPDGLYPLPRRRTPSSSLPVTQACFLSDTRRAPSTPATHARRRHTPSSTAPATHTDFFGSGDTRCRAHHARQDRHTIHCRNVTIGDYAQANTRPGDLALPLPARSLPLHRTTTSITLPAVASMPPARGVPPTTN
ncbi:hypothetical protein GUJ93_ZPchr0010g9727 [Zizania palustris]|uniref:Uncharacterized protein n=1 Tax=Zizania palustris TaxID=103762 RepID=A0A8J5W7K3_ZIZPA|nr:hypothetical protein GUJ93_ZPchr0010g9727 [Zizania palustris]